MRSPLQPLVSPPVQGALPGGEHEEGVEQGGDQGEEEHCGQEPQQPGDRAAVSEHAGVPGPGGGADVEADHEQRQPRCEDDGQSIGEAGVAEAAITEVQDQVKALEEVSDGVS